MEGQKAKGEKKTERIRRKAIEILKDYPRYNRKLWMDG